MRVFSVRRLVLGGLACLVVLGTIGVASAAATPVWWGLTSTSRPTNLPAGPAGSVGSPAGNIVVTAENRGYEDADGVSSPVVVRDTLPKGLQAVGIEGVAGEDKGFGGFRGILKCSVLGEHEGECRFENGSGLGEDGILPPFEELEVRIAVDVLAGASSSEVNTVSVSGGNGSLATTTRHISIGGVAGFGVEDYEVLPEEEGGGATVQAGAHPFQLTSVLTFDTNELSSLENQEPAGLAKDVIVQLPPGLLGDPTAIPQCTNAQFATENITENAEELFSNECPPNTAIGTATVTATVPSATPLETKTVPIFNLTPLPGEPARFGFDALGPTTLDASVRTGSDYGVTIKSSNITEAVGLLAVKLTFWGVPGDPRHDDARGWACSRGLSSCEPLDESNPPPFLSLPTSCTGPMLTTVQTDSWAEPQPAQPLQAPLFQSFEMGGLLGCNHLQFVPEVNVTPDLREANMPSGVTVEVHIPQEAVLSAKGLAESTLRELTLEFPPGLEVNPSAADGLEACSESQMGYEPAASTPQEPRFAPGEPSCPEASKVGVLEIETPLLPHKLTGSVYLATPAPFGEPGPLGETNLNPFGSLLTLYVVAKDPVSGTLVKLPVRVSLDPSTGRLVATSAGIPELPFETLRLHMFGEERAPLSTPSACGSYTTPATLTPWSGEAPTVYPSSFQIESGPRKGACPSDPPRFEPSLAAGSTSVQAGEFTPFTTTLGREDGERNLKSVQLNLPPGLLGEVSSVKPCEEAQANAGTCGPESQVGETVVSVGVGNSPYTVTGGRVYLTGPYEGAPYGLSIVNPANAGPFHLGNVIVRAKIEVNPLTAALTVTTDPGGEHSIPDILDGIPLQIKHVNVTISRPGFTFNPTSCEKTHIEGMLSGSALASSQTLTSPISVPFQATNCAVLGFKPKLTVTTSGKATRKDGTSLSIGIAYPKGAMGKEAWFKSAKFAFPKQLPVRLTTLQKACLSVTFASNPAACPPASKVGTAIVHTPVLPGALTGVVYFVSNGNAKFPEAVIVLQGDNITVDLHAETFIDNKTGISSATLRAIPGVPFENVTVTLPSGPYSEFAANGNLCTRKPKMSTAFTAQNGLAIHQSTSLNVTGCPKHVVARKARKVKHKGGKGGRSKGK